MGDCYLFFKGVQYCFAAPKDNVGSVGEAQGYSCLNTRLFPHLWFNINKSILICSFAKLKCRIRTMSEIFTPSVTWTLQNTPEWDIAMSRSEHFFGHWPKFCPRLVGIKYLLNLQETSLLRQLNIYVYSQCVVAISFRPKTE